MSEDYRVKRNLTLNTACATILPPLISEDNQFSLLVPASNPPFPNAPAGLSIPVTRPAGRYRQPPQQRRARIGFAWDVFGTGKTYRPAGLYYVPITQAYPSTASR
jgi:hypothetical protein